MPPGNCIENLKASSASLEVATYLHIPDWLSGDRYGHRFACHIADQPAIVFAWAASSRAGRGRLAGLSGEGTSRLAEPGDSYFTAAHVTTIIE